MNVILIINSNKSFFLFDITYASKLPMKNVPNTHINNKLCTMEEEFQHVIIKVQKPKLTQGW